MRQENKVKSLAQSKVTVLGAQRSGLAAAELLHRWGAQVFISDMDVNSMSEETIRNLDKADIEFEIGGHSDKVFDAELIIVSPGIPETAPVMQEIKKRQIPVISEVELASWFVDSPIIGITGSNGKTTTTTLVAHFLEAAENDPVLCGNIGNPFANELLDDDANSKKKCS